MKPKPDWKEKTLEHLEKHIWPALSADEGSYLIKTCNALRKKPLQDFKTEDLRIMIGQKIGLPFLIPLALETLANNLFAEGHMYAGDLLNNVLQIDPKFWDENRHYWQQLNELIKNHRQEIVMMKLDLSKFDQSERQ